MAYSSGLTPGQTIQDPMLAGLQDTSAVPTPPQNREDKHGNQVPPRSPNICLSGDKEMEDESKYPTDSDCHSTNNSGDKSSPQTKDGLVATYVSQGTNSSGSMGATFVDLEIMKMNKGEEPKTYTRHRERKISEIVESVTLWRKLYNGITDERGNLLRYSLIDASRKVGISKKSLDDYLLQLKVGKKYGFDFEKHKDDKVGVLRKFVRKHKVKTVKLTN